MSARLRTLLALVVALAGVVVTVGFAAAGGSPLWQADGISLCGASNTQGNPQIVSDGSGGAIVTREDQRGGDGDIYAQRVSGVVEVSLPLLMRKYP